MQNNTYGFYGSDASPQIINCEIIHNNQYGIYLIGACVPTFGSKLSEWNDIYGNGSGNDDRDLQNGSVSIHAQYVYWGTVEQSEIENRIHHKPDDAALGIVNYSPWTNATHDTIHVGIVQRSMDNIPKTFSLAQNHLNPFNPITEIKYALPRNCWVRLEVYNIFGQKVVTLVDGKQKAGYRITRWDAGSLSSGIYFYRLQVGGFTKTRKMILLK